jgi:hypothetical protein
LRLLSRRFAEENFHETWGFADALGIADKYKMTSGQVALAWILAEHSYCEIFILYILSSITTSLWYSSPLSRAPVALHTLREMLAVRNSPSFPMTRRQFGSYLTFRSDTLRNLCTRRYYRVVYEWKDGSGAKRAYAL